MAFRGVMTLSFWSRMRQYKDQKPFWEMEWFLCSSGLQLLKDGWNLLRVLQSRQGERSSSLCTHSLLTIDRAFETDWMAFQLFNLKKLRTFKTCLLYTSRRPDHMQRNEDGCRSQAVSRLLFPLLTGFIFFLPHSEGISSAAQFRPLWSLSRQKAFILVKYF